MKTHEVALSSTPDPHSRNPSLRRLLATIGPGILVAATGVGAGDLATAGFAGSQLGTAILWAVAAGAFMKFVLTEGLARWQLATGHTLLDGAMTHLGWPARVIFMAYLLPWSFFVGAALIKACGVTAVALVEWAGFTVKNPATWTLALGAIHSLVGVGMVWRGGFRLVERVMSTCVAAMFVSVIVTALLSNPAWREIATGLLFPRIPQFDAGGLTWTIGLIGGVGGTLTVLCYGYWILEEGRTHLSALRTCRIDLGIAYGLTALFGMALVVIAAEMPAPLDGKGVGLILGLGQELRTTIGAGGQGFFLVGAWCAVFTSLLGVWQAVPYVFADAIRFWHPEEARAARVETQALAYRGFLLALATLPLIQAAHPFKQVQKVYVVLGAAFIPLLAIVLVILNGQTRWVGNQTNRWWTTLILALILALAAVAGFLQVQNTWRGA